MYLFYYFVISLLMDTSLVNCFIVYHVTLELYLFIECRMRDCTVSNNVFTPVIYFFWQGLGFGFYFSINAYRTPAALISCPSTPVITHSPTRTVMVSPCTYPCNLQQTHIKFKHCMPYVTGLSFRDITNIFSPFFFFFRFFTWMWIIWAFACFVCLLFS